ncbi:DUF3572 domain-containing protein [Gymnodinialimonas ceratoperidinii]|uniref:DUF3572 domain-containing protein n=1 Tax=Gymnodinialimonas ceratoperidinii TaxID=2856823 RepID=A0A8F6YDX0_9RHOB|nr:DUF3572 domain-containing protein [Gymnodinialimonas ceratoperidinii]QXT40960.1 DUF3572 domain-containing protein [Gymnodinialimonas ceratoperidinii]
MQQEIAETQALALLAWLAGEEDILPVFMGATGVGQDDLRARAADPEFLASMMDFLLMDDAWVLKGAEATGIPAENFALIRAGLPGGNLPNWT